MSAKKKYDSSSTKKEVQPVAQLNSSQPLNIILPLAVVIVTFIVYRYTLHNQFLNWDDWIYVQKDPYITSFSAHNLYKLLFGNPTENYYHPITMLSLAMNYHFSKFNPEAYYFINILIHAANTVVIFFLIKILLESMSKNYGYGSISNIPWLAGLCALLHAVHPMHVESVAWMVERKDLLYGFFYFLGLIIYIKYIKTPSIKTFLPVIILYVCALLSKPMAVSFPLSLFAVDILLKRNGLLSLIIEKWPFFLLSIAGGILTFFTQSASGSIAFLHGYSFLNKLMIPFYSFFIYFIKAFMPFNLSSYYPYPSITSQGFLSPIFYVYPLIDAALLGIPIYLAYRAGENYFRIVVFGLGFFFANVVFILQFLSSGVAVVAERYSYVAYFGLFFVLSYFLFVLIENFRAYRVPVIAVTAIFVSGLAYLCDGRTKVWHDSQTLWKDVIKNHPGEWATPYVNLAQYYVDKGQMDSAFTDYNELVKMHTTLPEVYRNLANIYAMRKQYDASIQLYAYAIKYDSTGSGDTYLDRAVTYSIMGKPELALKDYNYAYSKDSNSEKILVNRAYTYLSVGQYDMAIKDYDHLIRINPAEASYYFRRGMAEANKGMVDKGINDYTKSLSIQGNNAECMYDLSIAYKSVNSISNALNYAVKAKQAGFGVPDGYIADLQKRIGQ